MIFCKTARLLTHSCTTLSTLSFRCHDCSRQVVFVSQLQFSLRLEERSSLFPEECRDLINRPVLRLRNHQGHVDNEEDLDSYYDEDEDEDDDDDNNGEEEEEEEEEEEDDNDDNYEDYDYVYDDHYDDVVMMMMMMMIPTPMVTMMIKR